MKKNTKELLDFARSSLLAEGKELHDQGDKTQILECLHWCLAWKVPIPPWLKQAFQNAYDAKVLYRIKSWDEVFGQPLKKGQQLETKRRNRWNKWKVYQRVLELHNGGAGEPIDKKLFETVGKEFGIGGGTVASQLYYEVKKLGGPPTADRIEDFEDAKRLSKIAPVEIIGEHGFWHLGAPEKKLPERFKKTRKLPEKLKNIRNY